jgi:2-polyprenyl-3-methyl-5-hydroxy-6-metoxy-1,4-benzoquinol methylase
LREDELNEFKQFMYNSYENTHAVFANAGADEGGSRAATFEVLLSKGLLLDKQAPVLDFGCGDGMVLSVAEKLGYSDLTGVDLSAALIDRAAQKCSAKFLNIDGLEFLKATPDQSFGTIIAFDVFEHLTRPQLLVTCREIVRTLRPGGRLLLQVPNGNSPIVGSIFYGDLTHEQPYTQSSLNQLLVPFGFSDIQAMEVAPVPRGLKSTIRSILWQVVRAALMFRHAIEAGTFLDNSIFTRNIFVIAQKAKS